MAIILKEVSRHFNNGVKVESMSMLEKATDILSENNEFLPEVLDCFNVKEKLNTVLQIGNVKDLLEDIKSLDDQVEKFDIQMKVRDISWDKFLEDEVAKFTLYNIEDKDVVKRIGRDSLVVETRYSAKHDATEYYNFSKFANFLRDAQQNELINIIRDHLHRSTLHLDTRCSARIIKIKEDEGYLLRAVTSENAYKNYGINFSVLVSLLAIDRFVKDTHQGVFIDCYRIDDSRIYLSFQIADSYKVNENISLSFNLVLENDEIKDSSVSFNGVFKLSYTDGHSSSYVYVRPDKFKVPGEKIYVTDMLSYTHSMNVETVYKKIQNLPLYIDKFIGQVSENAKLISSIKNPQGVKEFIMEKVKRARNENFSKYKNEVLSKMVSMDVKSVFDLFEVLRSVDELLGDDIESKNFWRIKLFNALIERGKGDD